MRATVATLSAMFLVGAWGFQSEPQTFVVRTDADTVAVEHLTRTANTLTGDLHLFEEKTNVHYVLHLRPDGSTETAEVANERPNFFSGLIVFGAPVNVGQSGAAQRLVRVPGDLLPVIGTSMGLIDYLIRLHTPGIGETVDIRAINIRNGLPGRVTIKRFARDSVLVDCNTCMRRRETEELRIGLSRDGGIDGAARIEQHWTVGHR
jgi:hypothetical protein